MEHKESDEQEAEEPGEQDSQPGGDTGEKDFNNNNELHEKDDVEASLKLEEKKGGEVGEDLFMFTWDKKKELPQKIQKLGEKSPEGGTEQEKDKLDFSISFFKNNNWPENSKYHEVEVIDKCLNLTHKYIAP